MDCYHILGFQKNHQPDGLGYTTFPRCPIPVGSFKGTAGFRTFLHSVNSLWAKEDPFFHDFWEKVFKCSLKNLNGKDKLQPICTGEQNLESLPGSLFEMNMTGHSYAVYNAIHVVAYALHLFQVGSQNRLQRIERKLFPQNIQPWEVIITPQV